MTNIRQQKELQLLSSNHPLITLTVNRSGTLIYYFRAFTLTAYLVCQKSKSVQI